MFYIGTQNNIKNQNNSWCNGLMSTNYCVINTKVKITKWLNDIQLINWHQSIFPLNCDP